MTGTRFVRARHAFAATIVVLASGAAGGLAHGKTEPGKPAAAPAPAAGAATVNAPPSAGQVSMRRGIEAFKKGDLANAVGSLSSAVSTGSLSGQDLARALYFRGLAYRKQGKPAQAISDLTNAIWLKDGLSADEHADALANRSAAYREAGLAEPGGPVSGVAAVAPAAATAVTSAAAAPTAGTAAAGTAQRAAAPAGNWQTVSTEPAAPAAGFAAAPGASATESSGGGIGGFFSNLFGGLTTSSPQSGDVTTASTERRATAAAPAAVSSWASGTEAQRAPSAAGVQLAQARTTPAAPAPAPAASAPGGKYKLQVGVLRTREEADRMIEGLLIKHAPKIGQRTTMVEETVLGNMGTFFRVNVVSFADAAEPERLCASLRGDGYDCLVVTK